jgi:hypothetical protein
VALAAAAAVAAAAYAAEVGASEYGSNNRLIALIESSEPIYRVNQIIFSSVNMSFAVESGT